MSSADTPLGEEREAYRVTVTGSFGTRTAEVVAPRFSYGAAQQAQDGASGSLTIEVVQLGSHAPSRAARIVVQL
jgi:hypothetical protein